MAHFMMRLIVIVTPKALCLTRLRIGNITNRGPTVRRSAMQDGSMTGLINLGAQSSTGDGFSCCLQQSALLLAATLVAAGEVVLLVAAVGCFTP